MLIILFFGSINFINNTILSQFFELPCDVSLIIPDSLKEHQWKFFMMVGIISPITEEIMFRLPLIFRPIYVTFSISSFIALITLNISSSKIATAITFFLLILFIYKLTFRYKASLFTFWNSNFKYIFYSLSILFGLGHLSNFEYTNTSQYFLGLSLIIPQLGMGFILSYTRMYYEKGFVICILTHILMNITAVSIYLHQI